jgi:tRNA-dihydrouridine synthase B
MKKIVKISKISLESPFILAPLAGYTDLPFRLLCREMGAGMVVSEMISCHGLVYGQEKTWTLLQTLPEERPWAVQLFGNEPEFMGQAAALVSERCPVDLIDINMGCPVRKVVKKGSGVALMKPENRQQAEAIVRAVVKNSRQPVSVKFRSGWNEHNLVAPDFARMCEAAGAAAVTIHARTWTQQFGGRADQHMIAAVKQAVSIPVIGNGDILSQEEGRAMMAATGCDAVMIGRGALGNPWIFHPEGRPENLTDRLPILLRYLHLAALYLPVDILLFRIKNHVNRCLSGIQGAANLRIQIMRCTTIEEIEKMLLQQLNN